MSQTLTAEYTPALPGHTGKTLAWYLKYKSEGLDAGSLRVLADGLRRGLASCKEYAAETVEGIRAYGETALADSLVVERRLIVQSLAEMDAALLPTNQLRLF